MSRLLAVQIPKVMKTEEELLDELEEECNRLPSWAYLRCEDAEHLRKKNRLKQDIRKVQEYTFN